MFLRTRNESCGWIAEKLLMRNLLVRTSSLKLDEDGLRVIQICYRMVETYQPVNKYPDLERMALKSISSNSVAVTDF